MPVKGPGVGVGVGVGVGLGDGLGDGLGATPIEKGIGKVRVPSVTVIIPEPEDGISGVTVKALPLIAVETRPRGLTETPKLPVYSGSLIVTN